MERTYPAQRFDIVQSVLRFQRRFAREKRHKTAPCNRSARVHNMTYTKHTLAYTRYTGVNPKSEYKKHRFLFPSQYFMLNSLGYSYCLPCNYLYINRFSASLAICGE